MSISPRLQSLALACVALALIPRRAAAQVPSTVLQSLVHTATSLRASPRSPSALALIKNRARTLGNQMSASRTRYFAVTDADLAGASPESVATRLSPSGISAADHVRAIEIVVDLHHPLTVQTARDQPFQIGTAIIAAPGPHLIDVHASIFASELTLLVK